MWEHRDDNPEDGAAFDKAMTAMTIPLVHAVASTYDFSGAATIVDVGGGQGALLAAVLRTAPDSHGVLFDQPAVVATSPGYLRGAAGVHDRVTISGGTFFETVPGHGDVYLLKSVLHDWEDEDCRRILRSCRTAMRRGAALLIIERTLAGPNQGLDTKLSDLNMLVMPGGKERGVTEYETLLEATGFQLSRVLQTPTSFAVLEAEAV